MEQARTLTPRQLDREKRILECTRQLLSEAGYEGLQMRILAERADVSPMTLYNRFGNKDDLILMALQDLLADLGLRALSSGKRGIEFVLHNAANIADQILETPKYARAMALMLFNGQPDSPIVNTLLTSNIQTSQDRIDEMLDMGEIDNDGIDLSAVQRGLSVCGWSTVLLWMKDLIPDETFKQEYLRAPIQVLAPAMTPATLAKYGDLLT